MPGRKKKVEKIEKLSKVKSHREIATLNILPDEVLLLILSYLSLGELLSIALTNKHLKALSQDEILWDAFIRQHFSYAQDDLLNTSNRRKSFIKHFKTAFDLRFFPDLQDKQQILNAFEGKIVEIFASDEDSDTIGALAATSLANQPQYLPFDLQGKELRLNDADKALALVCAARNQNLGQVDSLFTSLMKDSIEDNEHYPLHYIIRKALLQRNEMDIISYLFEKGDFYFNYMIIQNLLERQGMSSTIKDLTKKLSQYAPESMAPISLTLSAKKFFFKEAARNNKCIEIYSVHGLPPVTRAISARLVHLPGQSRNRITNHSEMQTLLNSTEEEKNCLARISIKEGYVDLFQRLLDLNYKLKESDYYLLGLTHNTHQADRSKEKKLFLQVLADKALLMAVKSNDKKATAEIIKNHSVSPLIRGESFIHAVAASYLKLLPILLGEDGQGVEESFFLQALNQADDEVISYLSEHYSKLLPFGLLRQEQGFFGAIISKISDSFSTTSTSKEVESPSGSYHIGKLKYLVNRIMNDSSNDDFTNPTELVHAFRQYAQDVELQPSKLYKPPKAKRKVIR